MKRIGIYCGSFNPFHNGHKNIYEKALAMFDEVFIAVGINPDKDTSNMYERREFISDLMKPAKVIAYQGLTTNLIKRFQKEMPDSSITLIRGLRDGYDLDYEIKALRFMQDLMPEIQVVMIVGDREFSYLSSSSIRALEKLGSDLEKRYLP